MKSEPRKYTVRESEIIAEIPLEHLTGQREDTMKQVIRVIDDQMLDNGEINLKVFALETPDFYNDPVAWDLGVKKALRERLEIGPYEIECREIELYDWAHTQGGMIEVFAKITDWSPV